MKMNYTNQILKEQFHIDPRVLDLVAEAEKDVAPQFEKLDDIMAYNQYKVLSAFQKNRISDMHFSWNTGYGYDDAGKVHWKNCMRISSTRMLHWFVQP